MRGCDPSPGSVQQAGCRQGPGVPALRWSWPLVHPVLSARTCYFSDGKCGLSGGFCAEPSGPCFVCILVLF